MTVYDITSFEFSLFCLRAELGGVEHGGVDGPAGLAGDEGIHRLAGGQRGGRDIPSFVPFRGRQRAESEFVV